MYFFIGFGISDRVPQNVKLPQAQRRFQTVVKVLRQKTHRDLVYRPLQFHKRSQLFIRMHNEAPAAASMRVSNPGCSPLRI
jgi:hypothetical protein